MDDRLEPITFFNTAKDLAFFYRKKQSDLSFCFSKPREFDSEFLPLLCYSAFFPQQTLFRLVPEEETIRDAEMRLETGKILGIQITQAMALELLISKDGRPGVYRPLILTKNLSTLTSQGIECDIESLDKVCQRLLKRIEAKVTRYQTLDYPSNETILLVFMNDPALGACFRPQDLLGEMHHRLPKVHLDFFAEIQVLFMQDPAYWALVNLTMGSIARQRVDLD